MLHKASALLGRKYGDICHKLNRYEVCEDLICKSFIVMDKHQFKSFFEKNKPRLRFKACNMDTGIHLFFNDVYQISAMGDLVRVYALDDKKDIIVIDDV